MREEAGKNDGSLRRKLFRATVGFFVLVMLVTSFFGKKGYMDIVVTRNTSGPWKPNSRRSKRRRAISRRRSASSP